MEPIDALRELAREKTNSEIARDFRVSPQFISQMLLGQCPVSERIAAKLGFEKIVVWRRIAA